MARNAKIKPVSADCSGSVISSNPKDGSPVNCLCITAAEIAVESLKAGKVIGVPTDTIYGIAALVQLSEAVESLYHIKKRHREKPIAICVGDIDDIYSWCDVTVSRNILEDLLPGPVTLVFQRDDNLNPELNPATSLIGVRIPNNHFIREVARGCGGPVALTSANLSAAQSSLKVEEFQELWPKLDVVFDGGVLGKTEESRLGSTVIDLSIPGEFKLIRDGCALAKVKDILCGKHGLENASDR